MIGNDWPVQVVGGPTSDFFGLYPPMFLVMVTPCPRVQGEDGGVGRVWRQAARDQGNPTWWLGRSRHVKRIYRTIIVYFLTASGRLKRYRLHFTCLLLRLEYSTMKICSNRYLLTSVHLLDVFIHISELFGL